MVWFQCEDCGDNLKKPKLLNHFRVCSANKLSCIDCGQVFGQQTVQGHTQCITESEKYGPKGLGKQSNGTPAKANSNQNQKADVVGLSERPPWFCSLCNTCATSKQTLLLHAEGKKHRAKARAFHASKQLPEQIEESTLNSQQSVLTDEKEGSLKEKDKEPNKSHSPENDSLSKKRKLEASENGGARGESRNGEVFQNDREEVEETKFKEKKVKQGIVKEENASESSPGSIEEGEKKKKIKWKKLITAALKTSPDGVLKVRRLRKCVLKALKNSGSSEDKSLLVDKLEQKIHSSSKFAFDGKYVRLVAKS